MNHFGRKGGPQSVQHRQNVDDFLRDRAAHRTEMAGGGEHHADDAQRHAADGALQRDGSHAAADVHELVHLLERVVHDHDAGRFGGHVAVLSDRHADRGGHHRRGVVDAVADVERLGGGGFLPDDGELLFGTLLRRRSR